MSSCLVSLPLARSSGRESLSVTEDPLTLTTKESMTRASEVRVGMFNGLVEVVVEWIRTAISCEQVQCCDIAVEVDGQWWMILLYEGRMAVGRIAIAYTPSFFLCHQLVHQKIVREISLMPVSWSV